MKFSIRSIIWTFVFLALILVAIMSFRIKPIEVETALVINEDLKITVVEDGKTRIREKYVVSTPVAGRLSRVELKPGDIICDDDQRIAVINPAEPAMLDARAKAQAEVRVDQSHAAVSRAAAATEQVRVNFERAKSKFERAEKLKNSNAISREEFDLAKTLFLALSHSMRTKKFDQEIAKYELETAKAALLQFSDEKESGKPFEIFAPVCGSVLKVFQESATVLNVGTPLVEIGDPQNLEIEIDVLSTDAVRIRPGAELVVNHWGGENPLKGTVRVIEPAAFTKISSLGVEEQRVNIIADFDESQDQLFSLGDGYRVEAEITVKQLQKVLQVPNSSLFRHQKEWHVFVVRNDIANLVPVTIAEQSESHTRIMSGLEDGDEVVLYPSDTIFDGSKISRTNQN